MSHEARAESTATCNLAQPNQNLDLQAMSNQSDARYARRQHMSARKVYLEFPGLPPPPSPKA